MEASEVKYQNPKQFLQTFACLREALQNCGGIKETKTRSEELYGIAFSAFLSFILKTCMKVISHEWSDLNINFSENFLEFSGKFLW